MSQTFLFLLVTGLSGVFSSRYALNMAPTRSELPFKTIFATVLAMGVALEGFDIYNVPQLVVWFALVFCSLYIYGIILIVSLTRGKRYAAAQTLTDVLYWTPNARFALRRLMSQLALQSGDTETAVSLLGDKADSSVLAQVYSLSEQWDKILGLEVPEGEAGFVVLAARVKAWLELGNFQEAEADLRKLRARWEQNQSVAGYHNLILSEARLAAEDGRVETVRDKLKNPPPGVPAYVLYSIVARACEQGGYPDQAKHLYAQAYSTAPEGLREKFASKLGQYEEPLPKISKHRFPYGSIGLITVITACFIAQSWIDNQYGQNQAAIVGAYILNFDQIPEQSALWRFLSYAFLHGGIVHIAFNCWSLFDLGRLYESRRNWGSLLASFVIGAIMGAYFTLIVQGQQQLVLVGASGGVLGVAGSLLADSWRGRSLQDRHLTRSLVQWMVIISIFGLLIPGVSFWGHTGGIVGGLLWGFIRQGLPKHRNIDLFAGGVSIAFIIYALLQAVNVFVHYVR
ncbi:MAG: rhomboid family intramembrane serine protease [Trueperaceae bacterium]